MGKHWFATLVAALCIGLSACGEENPTPLPGGASPGDPLVGEWTMLVEGQQERLVAGMLKGVSPPDLEAAKLEIEASLPERLAVLAGVHLSIHPNGQYEGVAPSPGPGVVLEAKYGTWRKVESGRYSFREGNLPDGAEIPVTLDGERMTVDPIGSPYAYIFERKRP